MPVIHREAARIAAGDLILKVDALYSGRRSKQPMNNAGKGMLDIS